MPILFRIFVNLYYKLQRALLYPIFLLRQRSFGLIVAGIAIYVLMQFSGPEETQPAVKNTYPPSGAPMQTQEIQDGNSSFSSNLLASMQPEELQYYSRTYYWVMQNQPAEQPHLWNYGSTGGQLTPHATFKNNYGHRCRRFAETLTVQGIKQTLDGIACEKPDGSWCKLGKNFTPICGLAPAQGIGNWWNRMTRELF